jgi:hypothetical protein
MLFKDKLKEPVIYKGSNKAINELNQIQEYLKTHTSKELEKQDLFSMVLKEKRIFYLN